MFLCVCVWGRGGAGSSRLSFAGCAKLGFYSPSGSSTVMGPGDDEYTTTGGKPEGRGESEVGCVGVGVGGGWGVGGGKKASDSN